MEKDSNIPKEIRDIWTDAYKFHATFINMGNTAEEWEQCANTLTHLAIRHNQHPLAGKLLMAVYEYLSEERKEAAYQEAVASG